VVDADRCVPHLARSGWCHTAFAQVQLQIRRIREGKVSAYLQGRKIVIGQDSRSPPVEIVRLIRKLRWMGMEEEAEDLQAKMQEAAPIGGVITTAYETD
jgi:hypothetical protein